MAEIADGAGYTVGALYSNFSGKRELFEAVLERERRRQFGRARSALDEIKGTTELAHELLQLDESGRRGWLLWLETVMEAQRTGTRPPVLDEDERESSDELARLLTSFTPGASDYRTLATALTALWRGWLLGSVATGDANAANLGKAIGWLVAGASARMAPPPGGAESDLEVLNASSTSGDSDSVPQSG